MANWKKRLSKFVDSAESKVKKTVNDLTGKTELKEEVSALKSSLSSFEQSQSASSVASTNLESQIINTDPSEESTINRYTSDLNHPSAEDISASLLVPISQDNTPIQSELSHALPVGDEVIEGSTLSSQVIHTTDSSQTSIEGQI